MIHTRKRVGGNATRNKRVDKDEESHRFTLHEPFFLHSIFMVNVKYGKQQAVHVRPCFSICCKCKYAAGKPVPGQLWCWSHLILLSKTSLN